MHAADHTSYEPGAFCLTLRSDLAFRRQIFGTEICYIIEDPSTSRFFRIGVPEYTFLSLLDGQTSIADAVAEIASRPDSSAFTETQATDLCRWLMETSLTSTPQSLDSARLTKAADRIAKKKKPEWQNPIMLKLPLGSPDLLLQRLTPVLGWCFGFVGLIVWLIVVSVGGYTASVHMDMLTSASANVLSADNFLWLGLTWLALKFTHEAAHGIACQRDGGTVRECGVLLLLFVPLPYVDVTSSWRFGSKWRRARVAAAGMYAELFVASLAAVAAIYTDSAVIRHHACNVMLTAGVITLLFNINPLMKFDGYYILSDLIEMPNLATHGQYDVLYLCRRWLLGIDITRPEWPEGRAAIVRLYGFAALVWRVLVCISLILATELLYHGAGIVLGTLSAVLWLGLPLMRFLKYLVQSNPVSPPNRLWFSAVAIASATTGYALWNYCPYVSWVRLPAIVAYDPLTSVRAGTSGFVHQIYVRSGQVVKAGTPLFELQNDEVSAHAKSTQLAIQQSQLDATKYHQDGNLAAFQVELQNEAVLRKRLTELNRQLDQLNVVASVSGTVLSRDIATLQNRWVSAGTEMLVLGDPKDRSVQFVVPQSDIKIFRTIASQPVRVHIWGSNRPDVAGVITGVEPRGNTTIRYPALTALAGGPSAVQPVTNSPPTAPPISNKQSRDWQLLEPHFVGHIELPPKDTAAFGTGQRGIVEFTTRRGTVGEVLSTQLVQFLCERRLQR